jgi:hypothetical protein
MARLACPVCGLQFECVYVGGKTWRESNLDEDDLGNRKEVKDRKAKGEPFSYFCSIRSKAAREWFDKNVRGT